MDAVLSAINAAINAAAHDAAISWSLGKDSCLALLRAQRVRVDAPLPPATLVLQTLWLNATAPADKEGASA